jgi:hypothetical protein
VGRIKRGGGNGGEPVRSPPGRLEIFAGRAAAKAVAAYSQACRGSAGSARLLHHQRSGSIHSSKPSKHRRNWIEPDTTPR